MAWRIAGFPCPHVSTHRIRFAKYHPLAASSQAYAVGDVDFLQLLDNWRQLLRYELGRERLESDLRQTLADLEQVVGGWRNGGIFLNQEVIPVPVPEDGLMLEEEPKLEELPPPAPVDKKNLQKDGVSEFK